MEPKWHWRLSHGEKMSSEPMEKLHSKKETGWKKAKNKNHIAWYEAKTGRRFYHFQ